jgi:hypothetical protein
MQKRLRNWVMAHKWFRQHGHAFSLEGRHRSNRGNEAEYENGLPPPPPAPLDIDIWDAWEVELAWRSCTKRSRWCLKYHYHDQLHPNLACILIRKLAGILLRHQDWRHYMRDARHELTQQLERRDVDDSNGYWPRMYELASIQ